MKLIVGVDPGITAALAFLDAESDSCRSVSRRNFSFSEMCEAIAEEGDPIIIAADTMHAPQLLKKISSTFGCRLSMPKRDMMGVEKKRLAEDTGYRNGHERDAVAAAARAKQEFAGLFGKVDGYLERKGMKELSGDVKELVVKGEAANIEQAVKMLSGQQKKETRVVSKIIESRKVLELREKIRQLERGKDILEARLRRLEEENDILCLPQEKMPDRSDARLIENMAVRLGEENSMLRKEIEELKEINSMDSYEIIHPYSPGDDIRGKVIIAEGDVARAAAILKPKAIICSAVFYTDVPLIEKGKVNIQRRGNFLVADRKEIEKAMNESFLLWLKGYRERHAQA